MTKRAKLPITPQEIRNPLGEVLSHGQSLAGLPKERVQRRLHIGVIDILGNIGGIPDRLGTFLFFPPQNLLISIPNFCIPLSLFARVKQKNNS
jgi:hypothetical protein